MSSKVANVLNDDIRVLIFAGDADFVCNYLGNRAWTVALDWDHKDEFNALPRIRIGIVGLVFPSLRTISPFCRCTMQVTYHLWISPRFR